MSIRTILLAVIFILLALFAALNWTAFTAPTTLSLLVASVQAPLGVILLAVIALLSALFLAYVIYLQGTVLVEAHRHARELQAHRELADKAEASRFTELRAFLAAEIEKLATGADARHATLLERLDKLDRDFGGAFERTESAIAAYIGELDERLTRKQP